ncbi:MAG: hypothetical protein PHS34_09635 [Candidatus Omnitrophica bacterium]|nr:hypothetical protein [Candidatus Omnitrophota bacterium]
MITNKQTPIEYYIDKHEGHETRLLGTWEWLLLWFLLVGSTILLWTCLKIETFNISQVYTSVGILQDFVNFLLTLIINCIMPITKWTLTIATPIVILVGCADIFSKHGIGYDEPEEK